MAELAKARSKQPYIILYKTTLQLGVRNLPKVFTRQRPGGESNVYLCPTSKIITSYTSRLHCAELKSANTAVVYEFTYIVK